MPGFEGYPAKRPAGDGVGDRKWPHVKASVLNPAATIEVVMNQLGNLATDNANQIDLTNYRLQKVIDLLTEIRDTLIEGPKEESDAPPPP